MGNIIFIPKKKKKKNTNTVRTFNIRIMLILFTGITQIKTKKRLFPSNLSEQLINLKLV